MILICQIGKYRLFRGQPLLGTVRLDAEANDLVAGRGVKNGVIETSERPRVDLQLVDEKSDQNSFEAPFLDNIPPGVIAVDTADIPQGVYSVRVTLASQTRTIPGFVWILEKESYRMLLRGESKEEFSLEPQIANGDELRRLTEWVAESAAPALRIKWDTHFYAGESIAAAPVEWIMRTVLEAFYYASMVGVTRPTGFVTIEESKALAGVPALTISVGVDAALEYPLPTEAVRSLNDAKHSDLFLVNENQDFEHFDVQLSTEQNIMKIALRQIWPQVQLVTA